MPSYWLIGIRDRPRRQRVCACSVRPCGVRVPLVTDDRVYSGNFPSGHAGRDLGRISNGAAAQAERQDRGGVLEAVIVAEGQDLGVRDVRKSYGRHEVLRGVDLPPGQAS
jgi:hypothetical protein